MNTSDVTKIKTEKKTFNPKPLDSTFFEKLVLRAIHEGKSEDWIILQVKAGFAMKGMKVEPAKEKPKSTFVPNSIDKACKFGKNCKHFIAGTCAFKKHE
jgi:hypothetical protein